MWALNEGQKAAADSFMDFMFSDETEMRIVGPGGVGKTALVNHLSIDGLLQANKTAELLTAGSYVPFYPIVCATTNKAVSVLQEQFPIKKLQTVHKVFGLRVKIDYRSGNQVLSRTNRNHSVNGAVVFIDEASMISQKLYDLLKMIAVDCKFVFIGDPAQLTAVKSKSSHVLTKAIREVELAEPVRTNKQDLQELWDSYRDNVFDHSKNILLPQDTHNINWIPRNEMYRHAAQSIQNGEHVRIVSYTNNQVIKGNTEVRRELGLPKNIVSGDVVINSNYYCAAKVVAASNNLSISVDAPIKVHDVLDTKTVEFADGIKIDTVSMRVQYCHDPSTVISVSTDHRQYRNALKALAAKKEWLDYFTAKEKIADLRYDYSSTVHKAQGQTFDAVYIDLKDIDTCTTEDGIRRLLYVAVSRARHKVYLIGD